MADLPSVLILEDDPDYVKWCQRTLGSEYNLTVAAKLLDAQALCVARPFTVMLVDLNVPDSPDGMNTVSQMRRTAPGTPLIAMTMYDKPPLTELFGAGADFFWDKNRIEPDAFLQLVGMAARQQDRSPIRVLVVEDDPADAKIVRDAVRRVPSDIEVQVVGTLAEAADALDDGDCCDRFDALLLDLHLPNGQGLECVRKVRSMCNDLPLIVHTGVNPSRIGPYFEAGADDFVGKDAPPRQVEAAILSASKRSRRQRKSRNKWRTVRVALESLESDVDANLERARAVTRRISASSKPAPTAPTAVSRLKGRKK